MIANFFRSLNSYQADYLLISGQATVLYGAATFSEDIDLWIRLEDYPIISRLALAWLDQPGCKRTTQDFCWAVRNIFTVSELRTLFEKQPNVLELVSADLSPALNEFARQAAEGVEISDEAVNLASTYMQARITDLQQLDRHYWRAIIAELKQLRAAGNLVPEGAEV